MQPCAVAICVCVDLFILFPIVVQLYNVIALQYNIIYYIARIL